MNEIVQLQAPTHIELSITERCNHKCRHCYNSFRSSGGRRCSMSKEQAGKILKQLESACVGYVTLTGGEPLMDQDLLFYMIDNLRKRNIGVGLNSNLTLMTNAILERLKELDFNNTILTSLPGFTSETCDETTQSPGSFSRIRNGIQMCRNAGVRVCVNVVVTKKNLCQLKDLIPFLIETPVDGVAITKVVPPCHSSSVSDYVFSKMDVLAMLDFMQHIREKLHYPVTSLCAIPWCLAESQEQIKGLSTKCAAGIVSCAINAISGSVTPCAHNEKSFGCIYEESLGAIWNRMFEYRTLDILPAACKSCKMLYKCGGECRLIRSRNTTQKYHLKSIENLEIDGPDNHNDASYVQKAGLLQISPFVRFREEAFGGVISIGPHEFYVKRKLFEYIKDLKTRDIFTFDDIKGEMEMNKVASQIIQTMIEQGVFVTVNDLQHEGIIIQHN